ncbi:hypothetical protein H2201_003777 [Coniosporium apollinis]|uniref:CSC1/OSCA1-like N-terminal transmembrane domain-containing protein n=1 Tax=Coniosporium apollinis TaxID=61459 RepID=A0ABQ9NUK9_9PEZI|nr:hypothetical protein H2201_003777 [Coniosporium apollinis]
MLDASSPILLSLAAALLLTALALIMLYPTTLLRWLQRKRYQYEVTFSLYMLTPTEKFIFNSFLFLILSMILIAASLYLPEHIAQLANRAFYYYAGDESGQQQSVLSPDTQQALHGAGMGGGAGPGHALGGQGRGVALN